VNENHAHLVTMGVSHPVLEEIRAKTASDPYRLSTKLTGAGGGGCSVTLLPDGSFYLSWFPSTLLTSSKIIDFPTESLKALFTDLTNAGFTPYPTSVGGSGMGVLSPWNTPRPLATPPDSPRGDEPTPAWNSDAGSLRAKFEGAAPEELAQWADERGRWLFV
jgi:hypothetical protein